MQITYRKNDGTIIQKYRKTVLPYNIGDMTSMGWIVLNIEYEYNNKFYPEYKYNILIEKDKKASTKKKEIKETCTKEAKTFIYCFIVVILISVLKNLFGI